MKHLLIGAVLACGLSTTGEAARCTTVLDPALLPEYEKYVARAEAGAIDRFGSGDLVWLPENAAREGAAALAAGKAVRWNISDRALNRRLAGQNGTVIHWIGAVRIHGTTIADLRSVLEDYGEYTRIYRPMVFACRAERNAEGPDAVYHVVLGLHNSYRFGSVFPQHYAFRVEGKIEYASSQAGDGPSLSVHLASSEIRESDSGVPGREDLLERYHDHGIMWAVNSYWRARQRGQDVYLEFESITLARSVEAFACTIGFVPIPKSILYGTMDSMPAQSVAVVLDGTRAECERRAAHRAGGVATR